MVGLCFDFDSWRMLEGVNHWCFGCWSWAHRRDASSDYIFGRLFLASSNAHAFISLTGSCLGPSGSLPFHFTHSTSADYCHQWSRRYIGSSPAARGAPSPPLFFLFVGDAIVSCLAPNDNVIGHSSTTLQKVLITNCCSRLETHQKKRALISI